MSEEVKNIETKAETVNIDIDELFNGAPSAEGITLPQEEPSKPNIFQKKDDVDMSFVEPEETVEETVEEEPLEEVAETPVIEQETEDVLDNIDVEDHQETFAARPI